MDRTTLPAGALILLSAPGLDITRWSGAGMPGAAAFKGIRASRETPNGPGNPHEMVRSPRNLIRHARHFQSGCKCSSLPRS